MMSMYYIVSLISQYIFRLRLNKGQMRTERLSLVGTVVGLGVAQYTGAMLEKGALFGMIGGCVMAGVLNSFV